MLRSEPPAPMRTLGEFFAMAQALEEAATARYAALGVEMRRLDLPDVAAVFEHLAAEERGHAEQVGGWAHARIGTAPDPAWIRWQPPETFDEEEARAFASSSLASAYRALSMAVRNEERAFALWSYIAAQAEDPAIKAAAERMAGEELHHAALLRRERRRAFHRERQGRGTAAGVPAQRLPPAETAAGIEQALATLLSALAERAGKAGQASELRRMAAEALDMAGAAVAEGARAVARQDAAAPSIDSDAPAGLTTALRLGEQAVEIYLDAGEATQDEMAMERFQSLAKRGIARLALLRHMTGEAGQSSPGG
jgi:rubrerythrin